MQALVDTLNSPGSMLRDERLRIIRGAFQCGQVIHGSDVAERDANIS